MGKAGKKCLDPWESERTRFGQEFRRALEIEEICLYLYEDENTKPDRLLGIDGRLKRNAEICSLACDIVDEKLTYDEAVWELKEFTESLFDKPKGNWVQLLLWNL